MQQILHQTFGYIDLCGGQKHRKAGQRGRWHKASCQCLELEGVVMLMCFFCVHHCLSLLSMCAGAHLEEDKIVV